MENGTLRHKHSLLRYVPCFLCVYDVFFVKMILYQYCINKVKVKYINLEQSSEQSKSIPQTLNIECFFMITSSGARGLFKTGHFFKKVSIVSAGSNFLMV